MTLKEKKSKAKKSKATVVPQNSTLVDKLAALMATATPAEQIEVGKALTTVGKAQEKIDKVKAVREKIKSIHPTHAKFESYVYTAKGGNKSRKVGLESDVMIGWNKDKAHFTMLKEVDIQALALVIKACGPQALADVILAAAADKDCQRIG